MPGLVEVWAEAEALGVFHQPFVGRCVDLNRAVGIFRVNRIAADVDVQRAAGEMRAVYSESGATGVW